MPVEPAASLARFSAPLRRRVGWGAHPGSVIDAPHIFAVVVLLLTVALFAAMIWAGNHQH